MQDYNDFRASVFDAIKQRSGLFKRATRVAKIGLIAIGGLIAGVGSLGAGGFQWPPSLWVIAAVGGFLLAALGAVVVHITEDTTDHLSQAMDGLLVTEGAQAAYDELTEDYLYYRERSLQLSSLYLAYNSARSVLEKALSDDSLEEAKLIDTLITVMRHDLRIALGFQIGHIWTLVVYKAELDQADGKTYLRCLAHDRAIDCEVTNARRWREGVGVAGMALAKDDEVAAPDIMDPAAISLFGLNNGVLKPQDRERYRSMFAVPVRVGSDPTPWGVVLASSSLPEHFQAPELQNGVDECTMDGHWAEAVRAVAGLVAVGVATCRRGYSPANDSTVTSDVTTR